MELSNLTPAEGSKHSDNFRKGGKTFPNISKIFECFIYLFIYSFFNFIFLFWFFCCFIVFLVSDFPFLFLNFNLLKLFSGVLTLF